MRRILVLLLAAPLLVGALAPAWAGPGGGTDPDPSPTSKPEPGPEPTSGGRADVALTYDGPSGLAVGDRGTLTFKVANSGPDPAEGVSLSVSLPPGLHDVTLAPEDPATTCTWNSYAYGQGAPPEADGPSPRGDGGYADCSIGTMAAGASFSLSLEATRTQARELYASAWAGGYTGDENYENNYVDVRFDPDRSDPADLALSMGVPKSPEVGEAFVVSLTVENLGPSDARTVVVGQDLPDGLEFESASAGCTYDEGDDGPPPPGVSGEPGFWMPRTVTCAIEAVPANESRTLEVTVQRVSGWELWSSAWVEAWNFDENYDNDYAYVMIVADPSVTSDLSISSQGPAETPLVDEEFDISFTVSNHGPASAGDVFLYDYLPPELGFVSSSSDACRFDDYSYRDPAPYAGEPGAPAAPEGDGSMGAPIYYGGGVLVCDTGLLGSGDSIDLTARLKRTSAYEIWHYASVGASNFDPSYGNNYTELRFAPDKSVVADLSVTMGAPSHPAVGDTFDFDISVANAGPGVARDVVLTDYVPEGLDFVSAEPQSCLFSDYADGAAPAPGESMPYYNYRELRCDLGDIEPGAVVDVRMTTTRTFEWEIWNGASATTGSYDPAWENDSAYAVLQGENPYSDCDVKGGEGGDSIITDECPVDTGPGADDVSIEAGSGSDAREIRTGPGRDDIRVALRTPSSKTRAVEVHSGRGADVITLTVAPGTGNARVVLHSGAGNDRIFLDIAPQVRSLEVVVKTAGGRDAVSSIRYAGRIRGRGWLVKGGRGADVILGGNGADRLFGNAGRDTIDAGAGNDLLDGGQGPNDCIGGSGSDRSRSC